MSSHHHRRTWIRWVIAFGERLGPISERYGWTYETETAVQKIILPWLMTSMLVSHMTIVLMTYVIRWCIIKMTILQISKLTDQILFEFLSPSRKNLFLKVSKKEHVCNKWIFFFIFSNKVLASDALCGWFFAVLVSILTDNNSYSFAFLDQEPIVICWMEIENYSAVFSVRFISQPSKTKDRRINSICELQRLKLCIELPATTKESVEKHIIKKWCWWFRNSIDLQLKKQCRFSFIYF